MALRFGTQIIIELPKETRYYSIEIWSDSTVSWGTPYYPKGTPVYPCPHNSD